MKQLGRVLLLLLAMMIAPISHACRCAMPANANAALKRSDVVVLAKANSEETSKHNVQTIQWKVLERFKGNLKKSTRFKTATVTACCMCGLPIEKGKTYLLYLNRDSASKTPMSVSSCSGSRDASEAEAQRDLQVLRAAKTP
jgi:hypothetical protein